MPPASRFEDSERRVAHVGGSAPAVRSWKRYGRSGRVPAESGARRGRESGRLSVSVELRHQFAILWRIRARAFSNRKSRNSGADRSDRGIRAFKGIRSDGAAGEGRLASDLYGYIDRSADLSVSTPGEDERGGRGFSCGEHRNRSLFEGR